MGYLPAHFEEILRPNAKGICELDQRVNSWGAQSSLQLADLGSMQPGGETQFFLAQLSACTVSSEVCSEGFSDNLFHVDFLVSREGGEIGAAAPSQSIEQHTGTSARGGLVLTTAPVG
jgi:hypothetical protein